MFLHLSASVTYADFVFLLFHSYLPAFSVSSYSRIRKKLLNLVRARARVVLDFGGSCAPEG